ncbi:uncharacterized protein LOC142236434 [Haematobia irritans]|uniref:uncharacterized protein LOC142236434 n=1 Tax=Haematobia irritans TaxID=7368 RepID=UPI003F505DFF
MTNTENLRKHALEQHHKRIKEAKAIVDTKPPIVHIGMFSQFSKLKSDVHTLIERNRANAELLVRMNEIFRIPGTTDCFRTKETDAAPSSIPKRIKELEKIEAANMILGKRILCVTTELDTWQTKRETKRKIRKLKISSLNLLQKYSSLNLEKFSKKHLGLFLRPHIWFDLVVKDIRPLGRIIVELSTEAAPFVILEFMRLCHHHQSEKIKFFRIYPSLWIEGHLNIGATSIIHKNLEYDKRAIDHGKYSGVLSFSLDNIKSQTIDFLPFAISFRPLRVLNGNRVGFGRIIRGLKEFDCIQLYGTKTGTTSRDIYVKDCGVVEI